MIKKQLPAVKLTTVFFGAGDRGRTDTVSPPLDFESSTSANSITPASAETSIIDDTRKIKHLNKLICCEKANIFSRYGVWKS